MQIMKMNRKFVSVLLIACLAFSGCVSLKGNTAFEYVPAMPKGTVPVKVTIEQFSDMRPEFDQKKTKNIEPVAEKITRKIYDDFKESKLFEQVFAAAEGGAPDIAVKGRIYKFYWKNRPEWYVFVPYLNLILLFGVPAGTFTGETKITIDLVSNKSGQVIASYTEESKKDDVYNGYRSFLGMEAGTEVSEAFRLVIDRIKGKILADKDKIVSAVS